MKVHLKKVVMPKRKDSRFGDAGIVFDRDVVKHGRLTAEMSLCG